MNYGNYGGFRKSYTEQTVQAVWDKGRIIANYDPTKYRKDDCGAWMIRTEHGNRSNKYGWEIDHIQPESQGGTDHIYNLRPLQWENNAARGDGPLTCPITAQGNVNVSR